MSEHATIKDLKDLIEKLNLKKIELSESCGSTGYLDNFNEDAEWEAGWGKDEHGRIFIQLPLVSVVEGEYDDAGRYTPCYGHNNTRIRIFQRYTDSDGLVSTSSDIDLFPSLITKEEFNKMVEFLLDEDSPSFVANDYRLCHTTVYRSNVTCHICGVVPVELGELGCNICLE